MVRDTFINRNKISQTLNQHVGLGQGKEETVTRSSLKLLTRNKERHRSCRLNKKY